METYPDIPHKTFTIEQANSMLPLVRAIVDDLVNLARDVAARHERLAAVRHVPGGAEDEGSDVYSEEIAQIEEEIERDTQHLREYVAELIELGVEPKSATEGLVDFPAFVDGRLVYLCWKLGESEILFWHELTAGFRGRQPLAASSAAASSQRPG